MADYVIKSGSTSPAFVVTLMKGDQPADITGYQSVTLRLRPAEGGALVVNSAVTVLETYPARVSYDWQAADTANVGLYEAEWEVVYSNGAEQVFPADGFTTVEITPDNIVSPGEPLPDLPDFCWPIDEGCCTTFDSYSSTIQNRAKALAGQTLRMLTGFRVGGCAITVRPCKVSCVANSNWYYGEGTFHPYINTYGSWVNACGCQTSCSHTVVEQIELPMPVGRVDQVKVDGLILDPTDYRVDDGRWLVRTDGGVWPTTQNMALLDTAPDTFSVTYLNAYPVDGLGAYAAGLLACEFAKACSGVKCSLPNGVTEIVRAGIAMTIQRGAFPDGFTGIREVDAYVRSWNPGHLTSPPRVWTPDRVQPRVTGG